MQEFGGTPRTSLQLSSLFRSISHLITLRTLRDHRMLISNRGAELLMDSGAKFPPGRGEADTKATSPLIQASVSADSPNGRYRLHRRPVTQGAPGKGHPRPLHGKTSASIEASIHRKRNAPRILPPDLSHHHNLTCSGHPDRGSEMTLQSQRMNVSSHQNPYSKPCSLMPFSLP